MAIPIDSITRKKLIIVKQIYQTAVIQSASRHNVTSRLLAVIGFDLAVETLLGVIVTTFGNKKPQSDFGNLINQCDKLLSEKGFSHLPDQANIHHAHSIRNDAQHKAKYPGPSDMDECRIYTRDFLRKVVTQVWDSDFEKISLTDIIQNQKVRDLLIEAEKNLAQNNYLLSARSSFAGLLTALSSVENSIVGGDPSVNRAFYQVLGQKQQTETPSGQHIEASLKKMQETIMKMQEAILYINFGIKQSDFNKCKKLVGPIALTISGPIYQGRTEEITQVDAEFVIAFSISTVAQIEGIMNNIDAPYD